MVLRIRTQGLSEECDKSLAENFIGWVQTGKMDFREGKNRLLFEGFSIIGKAAMKKTPSVFLTESSNGREMILGGAKLHAQ